MSEQVYPHRTRKDCCKVLSDQVLGMSDLMHESEECTVGNIAFTVQYV